MKLSIKSIHHSQAVEKSVNHEYIKLLILHVAIAYGIYLHEGLADIYFFTVVGYFLFITFQNQNRNNEALWGAAYISGAEVFWRMTDALIFYETGKYGVIVFLTIGLIFKGASVKTASYWVYLLILFPGIVIASMALDYDIEFRKAIAFNLSGPVCLGVSAVYCYYKKITRLQIEKVVVMLLLPLLATMFYLYFYTPTLQESLVTLSGNYIATAGYGPNQISTIFGLGFFLLITRLFVIRSKMINIIDFILLGMMAYRAIVTFSRGGVLGGLVCTAAFIIILFYLQGDKGRLRMRIKMMIISAIVFLSWLYSTIRTGGLIIYRYTNRNASGDVKEDFTTGRIGLIETSLEGFYHNPVLGLGVGKGYDFRQEQLGINIASHNEFSRLLSEHGLLGVIAILILIFVPVLFWIKFKNNYYFLGFMAFWFLTVSHSAMRIALPAFIYGLALLYIVDEKKNIIHR